MAKVPHVPVADIEVVFDAWKATRPNPGRCRFTQDRKDLIRHRLRLGFSASDLVLVIEYINGSEDDDCRWMRGHNPRRRKYLDLANVLRRERLAGRVEAAEVWRDEKKGKVEHEDSNPWEIR